MKKTLIIGATTNPARYAYLAAEKLVAHGHEIINIGVKEGEVAGVKIERMGKPYSDIDTITLYIGKDLQEQYLNYIIATKPARVIFNPGTENLALEEAVSASGVEVIHACTLVLLSTGQY